MFTYPFWFVLDSWDETLVPIAHLTWFPSSKASNLGCDLPHLCPIYIHTEELDTIELSVITDIPTVWLMEELEAASPAAIWTKLTVPPTSPAASSMGPQLSLKIYILFVWMVKIGHLCTWVIWHLCSYTHGFKPHARNLVRTDCNSDSKVKDSELDQRVSIL